MFDLRMILAIPKDFLKSKIYCIMIRKWKIFQIEKEISSNLKRENDPIRKNRIFQIDLRNWEMAEKQEDKNKHIRLREWSCSKKMLTNNKYPQTFLKLKIRKSSIINAVKKSIAFVKKLLV